LCFTSAKHVSSVTAKSLIHGAHAICGCVPVAILDLSLTFLYTNNEQIEKEYRRTIPFIIASKKVKYLGINVTNDVNGLYKENYQLLKKEIEEDYKK
jgi:hypothetical protein